MRGLAAKRDDDDARPVQKTSALGPAAARVAGSSPQPQFQRVRQAERRSIAAHRSLIGDSWRLFARVAAATLGLTCFATLSIPPAATIILVLTGLAATLFARPIQHFEENWQGAVTARFAIMLAIVGGPMLCLGLGLAIWAEQGTGPGWQVIVGVLVVLTGLSTILLTNRLPAILTAMIGLWLGVTIVLESLPGFAGLTVASVFGIYAALLQHRADSLAEAERDDRLRTQMRAEEILSDYERTGQGWFWETDRRGTVTYVSDIVGEILGRDPKTVMGRHFTDLFVLDGDRTDSERTLVFHLSARSSFNELAVRAASPDEERWWSINGRPVYDNFNNFVGFRGSGTDLTERRRSQENATRLAHYDSLTGLANRFQMSQTLEKILSAQRLEQRACAVMLLDLDRFKQVNDTLGHPAGDALLKQVAERLQWTVDTFGRVGRLGGDEFQILVHGKHPNQILAAMAKRVIENVSQPYLIDGHRVVIGVSIGIALSPEDGVTSEALIRNADLALYAAKDGGRGRHHFYAANLHSDAEERRQLEQDLRDAITSGGLELHYQPVVHTATERISGFEALLRWTHPVHGPLSPAKFIPIAEDAGLIAPIGEWALRQACSDLAKWPESVRVAVNVSPLQFANPALPSIVTSALASAQIRPDRLELEITESVFLNDDESTDAMFAALKRVGVRLALDDFGTGYSSLGYLKKAPFDKIKIDQSFVRGATQPGSRNGALIASIVSLAESLGMETTAEGVETLDELDLVRMLGCSHMQGFIYEKPMPAEAARHKLLEGLTAVARGPKSTRAARQTMLRKVVLDHGGQQYAGTIRNISATGALVEGLWNVPVGTIFRIVLGNGQALTGTTRWSSEDRMGMEFATPLDLEKTGRHELLNLAEDAPHLARAM
jgi:diguanylate cyclase (GGDEF)-like protein/PAS domain S-box-containing protein